MDTRRRTIVSLLWLSVAGVMALSLGVTVPTATDEWIRLFVVVLAIGLAIMHAFDPFGMYDMFETDAK